MPICREGNQNGHSAWERQWSYQSFPYNAGNTVEGMSPGRRIRLAEIELQSTSVFKLEPRQDVSRIQINSLLG